MSGEPFPDSGIEAHDAGRTGISCQRFNYAACQADCVPVSGLHFYQQWHLARSERKQIGKQRDMLLAVEQFLPGKHVRGGGFHGKSGSAHPPQVMIVKHDDLPVTGQADVAFDAGTKLNCGTERRQTVFGDARPMEPAVSEPHRAGI